MVEKDEEVPADGATRPRMGWEAAFEEMARTGDDLLVDGDAALSAAWDWQEWEW